MSDWQDDSTPGIPDAADRDAVWTDQAVSDEPERAPCRDDAGFDPAAFAAWLPRLGPVLWLDREQRRPARSRATTGPRGLLLLDHPALDALARCVVATAHMQVTSHGPREWLCFRDADGSTLARLYLLPDTDYLAWDEMTAAAHLAPPVRESAGWQAHSAFLRHALARLGPRWRARLLTFEHRRLPWLQILGARPPFRLSLIGLEVAQAIASSESAELSRH